MSTAPLPFQKMNGIGNEILVVDLRPSGGRLTAQRAEAISHDIFFDQLMAVMPPRIPGTDARLDIFNRDGSLAAACGNGTRCVAALLMDETGRDQLAFETGAGIVSAWRSGEGLITVDMGTPKLRWDEIPLAEPFHDTRAIELQIGPIEAPILHSPSVVSMGNPHAIFWVDDVDRFDLARIGPMLEHHPLFPERANISLAEVTSPESIKLRVWERGAGLTRACGSAACATGVAAVRTGRTGRKVTVSLPGGDLAIEWRESDGHVLMTGPWELERSGVLDAAPALAPAQ